jgi:hypothetical protein
MAFLFSDRVRESSISVGISTITLNGTSVGFKTFVNGIGDGNQCYYTIVNTNGEYEIGEGTVGIGTLSRDVVLDSSNAGDKVNFTSGTKDVFVTVPADYFKSAYELATKLFEIYVNFIDVEPFLYTAPFTFKINSIVDADTTGYSILLNDAPYVIGSTITQYDKIKITVLTVGFLTLNSEEI